MNLSYSETGYLRIFQVQGGLLIENNEIYSLKNGFEIKLELEIWVIWSIAFNICNANNVNVK